MEKVDQAINALLALFASAADALDWPPSSNGCEPSSPGSEWNREFRR